MFRVKRTRQNSARRNRSGGGENGNRCSEPMIKPKDGENKPSKGRTSDKRTHDKSTTPKNHEGGDSS